MAGKPSMNKITAIFNITVLILLCATAAWCATFKGKVIDADTKDPIIGLVVVAYWHEERATPTGSTSRLKDVKETLTDQNGEWLIEGPEGRDVGNISALFSFMTGTYFTSPPQFIFFKPAYCSWPNGSLIEACKQKIRFKGNRKSDEGEILELPKLLEKEDRLRALLAPVTGNNAREKQKKLLRLINEERENLGLKKY
jgi:hypothetical protein